MDMHSPQSPDETYQVADLWIDVGRQVVTRNGVQIPLPRLSFELLLVLAKAGTKLLTVEELMDLVWSPVIVNPETVAQRVKLLRYSLGDDPRNPRYIIGVRGRGYRAAAPAEPAVEISCAAPIADLPAPVPPRAPTRRATSLILAGVFLCLAIAGIRFGPQMKEDSTPPIGQGPQSVAVLPFSDMSVKHDQGYFADGLSDELINHLATISGLQVASKTSSFYFKGKPAPLRDIAKALHVANFLEGSVRTDGNRLRIDAELVRIDSGFKIWSASFDRPLTDLFKVQDEMADAVSEALRLSLVDHYVPRVAPTENIEAYTLYLKSLSHVTNNGANDYDAAVEELHAALGLDPRFADAWAQLSIAILFKGNMRGAPEAGACAEARTAAHQALTLNERLEEGHRAAGAIFQYCDGDLSAAENEFNRAIEVAPERADALRSYAWLLVDAGRFSQAQRLGLRAVERDPLNGWNYVALGDAYWRSGQIPQAEMVYAKAVHLNPTTASLHALYANVLLSANQPNAAIDEAERETNAQYRQLTLPIAYDAAGRPGDADQEIARYKSLYAEDDPGEIAVFYACRNDADQAIQWLRKFAAKHAGEFATLPNRIACFRNIASDSRYIRLEQQLRQEDPARPLTARARSFRHVDTFSQINIAQ